MKIMNRTILIAALAILLVPTVSAVTPFAVRADGATCAGQGNIPSGTAYNFATNADTAGAGGPIPIADGQSVYLIADEDTAVAMSFAAGDWTFDVPGLNIGATSTVTATLGKVSSTCTWTPLVTGVYALGEFTFTATGPTALDGGDSIAVRVTDTFEGVVGSSIDVQQANVLYSPPNSPDYPVPSVATILTLSLGAVMIAGAAYVNRRK